VSEPIASAEVLGAYARKALEAMLTTADRVADDELGTRPFGENTNSISALIVHSCAVCEFWLGHVGLGRPSDRDREGEFGAVVDRAELEALVVRTIGEVDADLAELATSGGELSELRGFLDGDEGDLSLVIHVLEELFQHLGHIDITADALLARRA
jgi:hypothetical protein